MNKGSVLLVAVAVLAAGCGSGKKQTSTAAQTPQLDESAARFVVQIQAELKQGKFTQAWQTLHPAEKRVVSVQKLASCYPKDEFPGTVTFRATKSRDVHWLVPGTKNTVVAKEVTVTANSSGDGKQTFQQHLVRRGTGWVWMLSKHYFDAAKSGSC